MLSFIASFVAILSGLVAALRLVNMVLGLVGDALKYRNDQRRLDEEGLARMEEGLAEDGAGSNDNRRNFSR